MQQSCVACAVHASSTYWVLRSVKAPDLQVAQGHCNLYGVVVGNSSFPEGFCQVGLRPAPTETPLCATVVTSKCHLSVSCQPSLRAQSSLWPASALSTPLKQPAALISSRPFVDPVFMSMHLAPEAGLVSLMGSCNLMFMLCIGFLHHPSALTWTDLTCYDVVFTENADSTMHFAV